MTPDTAPDLRAAFAARPVVAEADEDTLQAVWRAASGQASAEELAALLQRVRDEPSVAEAWRMARAVHEEFEEPVVEAAPVESNVVRGPAHWWRGATGMGIGTVMAMAAVAVMYVVPVEPVGGGVAMRAEVVRIENTLLYAGVIERSRPVLRWTALPEGTSYSVTITTDALVSVARAGALDTPEWVIPADALAGLPDGTVLLWRVEATLPDGARHRSATFDAVLR